MLEGILNQQRINYVLFHLNHNLELSPEIESRMVFQANSEPIIQEKHIIFTLSSKNPDLSSRIGELAVLFPLSQDRKWYKIDDKGNLIFLHDILKGAFLFLSGIQEANPPERDNFGRFRYEDSLQKKLDTAYTPLVNHYFKIIQGGLQEFCDLHNIQIHLRKLFQPYGFMMTHDVDQISLYNLNNLIYKTQQLIGLKNTPYKKPQLVRQIFKTIWHLPNRNHKSDPYWNFREMVNKEKKQSLKPVFYFLDKDLKNQDAKYDLRDKKIRELIRWIQDEGCETGIHGTVRSAKESRYMMDLKEKFQEVSGNETFGLRQHRLIYEYPTTSCIHEENSILYDATLGFAEQEGFRNAYCLPFKLYDFKHEKPFNTWEIPLTVMDATLLHYRKMDIAKAEEAIDKLLDEIKKFNGIFTLLWHNSFFDEDLYPGITDLYENIISKPADHGASSLTGKEVINKFDTFALS